MRSRVAYGGLHGVAGDIWIVRQNVFDRVAMLDATEHGINGHSCASNDWRAALNAGVNDNEWIALRAHQSRSYPGAPAQPKGRPVAIKLNLNSLYRQHYYELRFDS